MRTHRDIVRDHGASKMARELERHGIKVGKWTPARWIDRDNIPGEYWLALDQLGLAKMSELAEIADAKLRRAAGPPDSTPTPG